MPDPKEVADELLRRLKLIALYGPGTLHGLCYAISHYAEANGIDHAHISTLLRSLYKGWPEYSKHQLYPVMGNNGTDPEEAYDNSQDKWDKDTAYGRARWRLLF